MTQYVALLRGIGPGNPNMRNDKLRGVFEELGFTKVSTVISSGNVLFESPKTDTAELEAMVEAALPQRLGFTSTTIVRSRQQLERLVKHAPFAGLHHGPKTYLVVTFLQQAHTEKLPPLPYVGKGYKIVAMHDNAICSVVDQTAARTPDLMLWLEKQYGTRITTRTWLTVERILKRLL